MFLISAAGGWLTSCAALCACQACSCVGQEVLRRSARVAYCVLFTLAMILAWVMRDFAKPMIEKIPWIMRSFTGEPSDKWFGMQAVFRISMGNFLFFAIMALALIGVKYRNDARDTWLHHGNWLVKFGLWLLFNCLPFFFPNSLVYAYGFMARFGSAVFLVIQMLILLDFTQSWNDAWVALGEENVNYLWALLWSSVACFAGTLGLAGFLFFAWGTPIEGVDGGCSLNVSLITVTLLIVVGFSLISISPHLARNGSLFPSSVIALYCMYLCFSALQSEPHDYECNRFGHKLTAASGSTLAIGLCITLCSVTYAAFRAGSNTRTFFMASEDAAADSSAALLEDGTSAGLDGEAPAIAGARVEAQDASGIAVKDDVQPVSYNYSFFHMVFALASMYIAMLMTGWATGAEEKDLIDVGWTSVWVKVSTQWATAALYVWCLVAPNVLPDREFF